jgi:hypothetical protein
MVNVVAYDYKCCLSTEQRVINEDKTRSSRMYIPTFASFIQECGKLGASGKQLRDGKEGESCGVLNCRFMLAGIAWPSVVSMGIRPDFLDHVRRNLWS